MTATGEDALRELLVSRMGAAYRLAICVLRDPEAAEDAVQEAALRAWDHRRELRDPARVDAWFSKIVLNLCRKELQRRSKPIDLGLVASVPGASQSYESRDEVARALALLTPDEQMVLAMRYGRDLTVPQIATQTGLREGTVKSRLHNAVEHLRTAFAALGRLEVNEK